MIKHSTFHSPSNTPCFCFHSINQCSGHGLCHIGFCKCHPGWYGLDCSRKRAFLEMEPGTVRWNQVHWNDHNNVERRFALNTVFAQQLWKVSSLYNQVTTKWVHTYTFNEQFLWSQHKCLHCCCSRLIYELRSRPMQYVCKQCKTSALCVSNLLGDLYKGSPSCMWICVVK